MTVMPRWNGSSSHERGPAGDPHPDPTPDEPTCTICGGRIRADDVVCPHCGASLVAG